MRMLKGMDVPPDIEKALRAVPQAWETFQSLRPSSQRSHTGWVDEPVDPRKREARLQQVAARVLEYAEKHPERVIKPKDG